MALVKADEVGAELEAQLEGFNGLPMARQIGLMVGFAATIAFAVAVVLWSQEPSYRMLYGNLPDQEVLSITTALEQSGISYQINEKTGAIMVKAGEVHDARMKLAGVGLPKTSGSGYELLDTNQGFGTSQFAETARYNRAMEGELSRTISSLNNVESARVHLAIPKQSSFVRNRKKTSASVMVNLYQGRGMSAEQANSISRLVASSIPNLEVDDVTVVDQDGKLLSKSESENEIGYTATQFEYRKKLEENYIKRIEEILVPIVGVGRVRAQVSADLDFTVTEQTQESYNPDLPSIRSEQSIEEDSVGSQMISGIPGSLTNKPPGEGTTVEDAANSDSTSPKNSSRRLVRNYELDRTVSHTRHQTGNIRRLTAAVVVDDKTVVDEEGKAINQSLTEEEVARITSLVREAIGFDAGRGDSVNVINAQFMPAPEMEPLPELSLLEQPWAWDALKQVFAFAVIIFLIFGVIRPVLKSLAGRAKHKPVEDVELEEPDEQISLHKLAAGELPQLAGGPSYEQHLEVAKTMAKEEPKRVAHIVREWVNADG